MAQDEDYVEGRLTGKIYRSREFEAFGNGRSARMITQVYESGERDEFVETKGEIVLRATPTGRQQIKAFVYVDPREVVKLTFQKFSVGPEKPRKQASFSLEGDEISRLLDLASYATTFISNDPGKQRINEADLEHLTFSKEAARALAKTDIELVIQVAQSEAIQRDVIALGYRRSQLERFRRMLEEPSFFASEKARLKVRGDEALWQRFFESNTWIFGYGLFYVFSTELAEKKLEQYVSGHSVAGAGKRADALLRTRGLVSSLCFVEIKTHSTDLLESSSYRTEVWAASHELAGGIAQAQKTVMKAEEDIGRRLKGRTSDGTPTGDVSYLLRPRSVLVVGSLSQFRNEHGVNEEKFSSFEMLRRSIGTPEIITYDELYERARFITEASGDEASKVGAEFPE